MTVRVFHALARYALDAPDRIALRSGERSFDYASLAAFLAGNADTLKGKPRVVGIATTDPLEAALADLAATYHGHVAVHLPAFFSPAQNAHIVETAGIESIIGGQDGSLGLVNLRRPDECPPLTIPLPPAAGGARRISFTSGSSGKPKGVVISERQMAAAIGGLESAIRPTHDDTHLSLLPIAQLLEQVAGLYLPLLAGAQVVFCAEAMAALFGGPLAPVLTVLQETKPTTTILVPSFLGRLVSGLRAMGRRAPASLRLIAVGGAATSSALLTDALSLGLPVCEGYGLSECCSVVALNRPGRVHLGTVGEVLDGVAVRIENGEIVVSGPTVMDGYLGHPPVTGDWYTGDLGRIEDGRLIVEGRKDWLIVTPEGRNVNPEWIEACLCADPRIPAAGVHLRPDGKLEIIAAVTERVYLADVFHLLADLPTYARPARVVFVAASTNGIVKAGGGIDRSQLSRLSAMLPSHRLYYEAKECIA